MSKEIAAYFKKIGRKGGETSKRHDMKGADSPGQVAAQEGRKKAREAKRKVISPAKELS